jgi:hypothetical protein
MILSLQVPRDLPLHQDHLVQEVAVVVLAVVEAAAVRKQMALVR